MCSIVKEVLLALLNWEMEEKACFYDHIPSLHQLTHLALQTGSEWVIQHFPSLCLFFSVAPCARHHKTAYASHTHDWILPQAPEQRERLLAEEELGWKPAKKKKKPTMPSATMHHVCYSHYHKGLFSLSYFSLYLESNRYDADQCCLNTACVLYCVAVIYCGIEGHDLSPP